MNDMHQVLEKTQKLSLLLVEDYTPLRKDLEELLQNFFHTVISASDGQEGLDKYREYHQKEEKYIDIVLSDIEMPYMNGITLTQEIQSMNESQAIIILSAYSESKYLLAFINLGIAHFLTKPLKHKEFISVIYDISNKIMKEKEEKILSHLLYLKEETYWDLEKSQLFSQQKNIKLTRYELLFIEFLIQNIDRVCSSQDIISYFYNQDKELSEESLRNLVFKLRKKIPTSTLESVYGVGYKLTQQ